MNEKERKNMMILADMIEGEINRMCVTKEFSEFDAMYQYARTNIDKLSKMIYVTRFKGKETSYGRCVSEDVQIKPIRCKDCVHWDTSWQNDYAPNYHYCHMVDGTRKDGFYCADAERKQNGCGKSEGN